MRRRQVDRALERAAPDAPPLSAVIHARPPRLAFVLAAIPIVAKPFTPLVEAIARAVPDRVRR